ncbi:MAG: sulfite exporter TauE/SafE family protein [Rhodospirillales bacterium]
MDFSLVASMETWALAFMAFALFAGGLVKGVCGLGLPIVAMGLLTLVFPPPLALAAVSGSMVVTNLWQARAAGAPLSAVKRYWPLIICMIPGLFIGAWLAADLDPKDLFLTVGVIVTVFCALNFWKPDLAAPPSWAPVLAPVAGAAAGLMGGVSTVWGPPITMYFLSLRLDKDVFVQAVGVVWAAASIPLVIAYELNGILNPETRVAAVFGAPAAMAGLWLGERVRSRLPQDAFRKVLLMMFLAIGVNLIRRGL